MVQGHKCKRRLHWQDCGRSGKEGGDKGLPHIAQGNRDGMNSKRPLWNTFSVTRQEASAHYSQVLLLFLYLWTHGQRFDFSSVSRAVLKLPMWLEDESISTVILAGLTQNMDEAPTDLVDALRTRASFVFSSLVWISELLQALLCFSIILLSLAKILLWSTLNLTGDWTKASDMTPVRTFPLSLNRWFSLLLFP